METEKQGMIYLFEWNKIARTKYTRRFAGFVMEQVKFDAIDLGPIKLSKDRKSIRGTFKQSLDDVKPTTIFRAFDESGNDLCSKILFVRQEHDSIVVYAKDIN